MNQDIEPANRFRVDRTVADASVEDYDALLLPGGVINPDKLRISRDAIQFVKDFSDSGKPIGVGSCRSSVRQRGLASPRAPLFRAR